MSTLERPSESIVALVLIVVGRVAAPWPAGRRRSAREGARGTSCHARGAPEHRTGVRVVNIDARGRDVQLVETLDERTAGSTRYTAVGSSFDSGIMTIPSVILCLLGLERTRGSASAPTGSVRAWTMAGKVLGSAAPEAR
jgi:hypothetical protein